METKENKVPSDDLLCNNNVLVTIYLCVIVGFSCVLNTTCILCIFLFQDKVKKVGEKNTND